MVIKFRCPNGHPLAASERRAGSSGQCPRCQAQFVVPAAGQTPHATAAVPSTGQRDAGEPAPASSATPAADTFMFLCPNGHKLSGSPAMQGRPGQCPQCHSRFLIPTAETDPEGDALADESFEGLGDSAPGEIEWDALDEEEATADRDAAASWSTGERRTPPPVPVSCHPLAHLIRRLGADAHRGGPLEVRLADGTVVEADSCSIVLSQHEYGVFAVRGGDKSISVVIIPWDQITRVTVPRVAALPADWSGSSATPTTSRPDRLR